MFECGKQKTATWLLARLSELAGGWPLALGAAELARSLPWGSAELPGLLAKLPRGLSRGRSPKLAWLLTLQKAQFALFEPT